MNTMMVTEQNAEFYLIVMKKQMYEKHPKWLFKTEFALCIQSIQVYERDECAGPPLNSTFIQVNFEIFLSYYVSLV